MEGVKIPRIHFVSDLWGGDLIHVRSMIGYQKSLTSSDWGPTNHGTSVLYSFPAALVHSQDAIQLARAKAWKFPPRMQIGTSQTNSKCSQYLTALTISHNQNTSTCDEARIEDLEQQVKNLRVVRDAEVLLRWRLDVLQRK